MRLRNKVAFITGGGTGIGRATAVLFAKEGAKVCFVGRREEELKNTADLIKDNSGEGFFIKGDICSSSEVKGMIDEAVGKYGRLDILVNNAGIIKRSASVTNISIEDWDDVININLKGLFLCSRYALQRMIENKGGSIINISSILGIFGAEGLSAYCASKGGVLLLTKSMARDYGRYGIRVNSLCPGLVDTPLGRYEEPDFESNIKNWQQACPLGRVGKPEDIAYAALYFASDESQWITGSYLVMDGGYTA